MLLQKYYFLLLFRLVKFGFLFLFLFFPPNVGFSIVDCAGVATGTFMTGLVVSSPITIVLSLSMKPDIEFNDLLDESLGVVLDMETFLSVCVDSDPVIIDFILSTEPDIENNDLLDESLGDVGAFGDGFIISPVVSEIVAYVNTKDVIPIKTYDNKGIWSFFILKL